MKIIAGVYCHALDECFLEVFSSRWKSLYPEIELIVLSDLDSPIITPDGYITRPGHWAKKGPIAGGVVRDLHALGTEWNADWILKLDVDCLHLNRDWLNGIGHDGILAVGMKHNWLKGAFIGAAYAVRLDALASILDTPAPTLSEDTGISTMILNTHGSRAIRINPLCAGLTENAILDQFTTASIIHCGQLKLGEPDSRNYCASQMKRLHAELTMQESRTA